jgi:Mn2+/Fe2+ NRAMP family transporter
VLRLASCWEGGLSLPQSANALDAIKLISDWAKWLITIETASIAVVAALFTARRPVSKLVKVLGTSAACSFLVSIIAAAMLLATLPEITQNLSQTENIWRTRDSVAGRLLHLDTQGIAVIESTFFGLGIVVFVAMVAVLIWANSKAAALADAEVHHP